MDEDSTANKKSFVSALHSDRLLGRRFEGEDDKIMFPKAETEQTSWVLILNRALMRMGVWRKLRGSKILCDYESVYKEKILEDK